MNMINRGNKTSPCGTVIAVDVLTDAVHFCSPQENGGSLITNSISFAPRDMDKAFFKALGETVGQEIERNPQMDVQRVFLILPDRLFLQDTLSVPAIHRKAMQQSISLAVESIYQNTDVTSIYFN